MKSTRRNLMELGALIMFVGLILAVMTGGFGI